MTDNITQLSPEEIVELLMANLSECNSLVSALSKNTQLNRADLRKLRNDLMFARSKARNLGKALEDSKRPVNAFNLSSK